MNPRWKLLFTTLALVSIGACTDESPVAPAHAGSPDTAVHAAETAARSHEEIMANGQQLFSAHCSA